MQWENGQVSAKNIAIQVNHEHFLSAIKDFVPSTLRDVESDIPNVDWENDLVGLKTEKEALIEAIELPFRHAENFNYESFCVGKILLVGSRGSGRKTLVYALAKRLGIRCLDINLLRFISRHEGIENAFFRLKQLAYASSPCILLLHDIEEITRNSRLVAAMENFFDEIASTNHVYTILTAESERTVPPGFFQLGRIDHLIQISSLVEEEQKQLLLKYLPQVKDEQLAYFIENFGHLSSGELIYVLNRCRLVMLNQGWFSNSEIIDDSLFERAVKTIKATVVERTL